MSSLPDKVAKQIDEAVEIMRNGGVVAFPTDTVYGLGGDVFNVAAVEKIYKIKQRPYTLPLPVLLANASQAAYVADSIPEFAGQLMDKFWPGGLTIVLNGGSSLPKLITAGGNKVAIRVPDHAVPIALISKLGKPIAGTSANLSNSPSVSTAEEVAGQLGSKIDLIIDGGKCPGGLESTVVDITGDSPIVLRQGAVAKEEIMRIYEEYKKGG